MKILKHEYEALAVWADNADNARATHDALRAARAIRARYEADHLGHARKIHAEEAAAGFVTNECLEWDELKGEDAEKKHGVVDRGEGTEEIKRAGIFVHGYEGKTYCEECIPEELKARLGDDDVEVWEEYSSGWTAPLICSVCSLAIPIYVDLATEEIEEAVGDMRVPCECGRLDAFWRGPEGLQFCCNACWAERQAAGNV